MPIFGKQKDRENLDPNYYRRRKIYNETLEEEREKNARATAKRDAQKIANQVPFYQKVINVAGKLGKDIIENAPNTNPDVLLSFDDKKPKRKTKKKNH